MKKSLKHRLSNKLNKINLTDNLDKYLSEIEYIEIHYNSLTHDDMAIICKLMSRGLDNICHRWQHGKTLHSSSLERFIIHFGDINGPTEYAKTNQKKKAGLPNTIDYWVSLGYTVEDATKKITDVQTARSRRSPAAQPGSKLSHRSLDYWLNKGFPLDEAMARVRQVQTTNGLQYYIDKYGLIDGEQKFKNRINKWQHSRKTNPNYKISCYMQGHGFDQYVIRHGDDAERKWKEYKTRFAHRGSKESAVCLAPILDWLIDNNVEYNFGPHNSEYIIVSHKRAWYFDLTIPSLKVIVEYHGERFHPNPAVLSIDEWNNWKNPYNNETAEVQHQRDCYKRQLAELHGFTYFEVYSSDYQVRIPEVFNFVKSSKSSSES